jgi:hypothetical protein
VIESEDPLFGWKTTYTKYAYRPIPRLYYSLKENAKIEEMTEETDSKKIEQYLSYVDKDGWKAYLTGPEAYIEYMKKKYGEYKEPTTIS